LITLLYVYLTDWYASWRMKGLNQVWVRFTLVVSNVAVVAYRLSSFASFIYSALPAIFICTRCDLPLDLKNSGCCQNCYSSSLCIFV